MMHLQDFYFFETSPTGLVIQGQIVERLSPAHFLARMFDSTTGDPQEFRVFHLDEMSNWLLFATQADFLLALEGPPIPKGKLS